jgi:hypothetical protein
MMQHHPRMVYTAIAIVVALMIATIIVIFIPEKDCPEDQMARFRWAGWECHPIEPTP